MQSIKYLFTISRDKKTNACKVNVFRISKLERKKKTKNNTRTE